MKLINRWVCLALRRLKEIGAFSILVLLTVVPLAQAQTYPVKPIRIVVPFGAGGVADLTARIVAQKMSEGLGQSVVVDNRPGAGGVVAADLVAKS